MPWLMAPLVAVLATIPIKHAAGATTRKVREPAVAGGFYPADPKTLSAMITDMLAKATPAPVEGEIVAAVAPHAGYPYSGPVAAWTYAALKNRKYARVVVIAPSHYAAFDFTSAYDGDAYQTPLGTIPVDKQFIGKLAQMSSSIHISEQGHAASANGGEHAIEVELPWLQTVLGSFELVPIVMGDQSYQSSRELGVALAKLISSEREPGETLILASSDLSHYHTYNQAETIDHNTLEALAEWDYFSMSRNFDARVWEACGGGPIVAAMIYSERMGATKAQVLRYANSGDTGGDHTRVVGYSADLFVKTSGDGAKAAAFSLTETEKEDLLALARQSTEYAVRTHKIFAPSALAGQTLNQEHGAFVTLTEGGELRGCVGYTSPVKPLYLTVRDTATLAALRDARFRPVSAAELPMLAYEISVLSPLRHVSSIDEIEVGRDGLLVRNGDHDGLLLPQVAVDQKWDRQTFLQQTCVKAGLPPDCWKDEKTDIFRFTAVVFGDKNGVHAGTETQ